MAIAKQELTVIKTTLKYLLKVRSILEQIRPKIKNFPAENFMESISILAQCSKAVDYYIHIIQSNSIVTRDIKLYLISDFEFSLPSLIESYEEDKNDPEFLDELYDLITEINEYIDSSKNTTEIDSLEYYHIEIEEFQSQLNKLQAEFLIAKNPQKDEYQSEINRLKDLIEDRNRKVKQIEKEQQIKKDWSIKITETFDELKHLLSPIETEQNRLKSLYHLNFILMIFLILFLVLIDALAINKIIGLENIPDFKTYITVFLPVAVAGALLWGSIYQMNRAQRQLVIIAKNIHKINYIQGLLLSINNLSPDIQDGVRRINSALDKLIDNYLKEFDFNTEQDLRNEEKKDTVPIDLLYKLLSFAKGADKS